MQKIDPKKFKIHASAAYQIMAGAMGLTEAQASTLWELQNKSKARTDKQEATMQELIRKRDNPELPQGAKTFCLTWLKEQLYGRPRVFTSKYTDRGNMSELEGLEQIRVAYGLERIEKNDEFFENEWVCGTPDCLKPLLDLKCPWECWTFPLFETSIPTPDYEHQLQVYMDLTGEDEAKLVYRLIDTPEPIIIQEARGFCMRNGEEFRPEIVDEFRERMKYNDDIPPALRHKEFKVERDNLLITQIHERVEMCRNYIESVLVDQKFINQLMQQTA